MKRALLTILAVAAFAPAVAQAESCHLVPVVVNGKQASSRSIAGSCSFVAGSVTGSDLLLRCGRGAGSAVARYDFKVPKSFVGSPAQQVSASKRSCGDCSVSTRLARIDDYTFRVTVSLSGAGQLDVRTVRFSYYTR
jgi:hypothetical protein